MEFHFNPTINNQTITIPPSSRCVHFYAFLLEQNNQLLPEIWISESEEQQQQWRSIRFNQNHPFLWHASLQLNPNNCNYQFTYRLISESSNQITWLGTPSQDGRINRTTTTTTNQLDLLLNACLVQSTHHSITHIQPDIQYHRITFSAQDEIHLDKQLAEIPYELLAFERSKPVWFTPRPLIHLTELSTSLDTVLLVLADPSHNRLAVMFPISTKQQYSTIRSTSTSPLTICTEYSKDIHSPITLVLITGPCSQLSRMMAVASGAANHSPNQSQEYTPRGLGYCTWDSLGPEYKLSQVLTILDSFQAAGIDQTLDRVLLDDGWQDVSGRALAGWDANKTWLDSSSSLASAIQAIRDHHRQAIKFVGVWITITGYWHGLDPESELMRQFQLQKWTLRHHPSSDATPPSPVHWFLPSRAQLRPFWNSYFGYLKSAGVDFVKIDNQAGLDQLLNCESDATEDPSVYKITLLDLLDELIPLHFGQGDPDNKVIHSMAHSPHIWLREYPLVEEGCSSSSSRVENSQKIMRTSDDFFPDLSEPDGHRWHILSNAFMSLVAQGRGFIPDFDMTMSGHEWGGYHACMRAFSSAPIYLTDRRGQHSLPLVEQLAAPLKANPSRRAVVQARDGAGVVLSSCALGQPALDLSSATTPWGLLKVGLAAPYAGGALVGLWNVKQKQGSSEDALSTKAVDILTARDIAEAMLSLSLDDQPKLSTKQAMSPKERPPISLLFVSANPKTLPMIPPSIVWSYSATSR
ncbi:hypothetical protein PCASD_18520 [Puccinia coronata f. sp. avenae]|uniref:Uncharacterized protein n=1 Tax=Puccinia coronata f. sp. avenae TaxID=200324 RepID=A0A2N5SYI9_9BASI|nr:hypothetical protein PCASD_18520 [Puccinia coronata f. sp. avenae]